MHASNYFRQIGFILFCASVAVGGAGCTDEGKSLVILRNQSLDMECVVGGNTMATAFVARGRIFAESPIGYVFTPIVQSRIVENATPGAQGTDLVFLEGANVDLQFPNGGDDDVMDEDKSFFQKFAGSITPTGNSGLIFEIVSPRALTAITTSEAWEEILRTSENGLEILAEIQILGKSDGDAVSSQTFEYPISVRPSSSRTVACDTLPADFEADESGHPCNPYQDVQVPCCRGEEGNLVCPAAPGV